MPKNSNYQNLSKEELIIEIERLKKELKKRKKYGLVWEGKREDVVEMCKEKLPVLKEVKSKEIITDKEKPVNLLIEGDNYHALSVLNYTHAKKVDVIYIDPPYNTGNKDFIFNDYYVDKEDAYRHSKWLSFMEKRLRLARNLLRNTGIIFISIDSVEFAQLKLLMDDIFGENNFLNNIIWKKTNSPKAQSIALGNQHEYILMYARNANYVSVNKKIGIIDEKYLKMFSMDDNDGRGPYRTIEIEAHGVQKNKGRKEFVFRGRKAPWLYSLETLERWWKEGRIYISKTGRFRKKEYLKEMTGRLISDLWVDEEIKPLQGGSKEYLHFPTQKPLSLIKRVIKLHPNKNAFVLDFFAGSGTTGEAVLRLNNEDGGNRKFVLCTYNKENENGKIIDEYCYPRLKKAILGDKKKSALGGNLKYFKTDFVDAEPTDKNKIKLTKQATEMLCIKEGTFDLVQDRGSFKIFKNSKHYTGIIFDQSAIPEFKRVIKDIKGRFSVYIFSLGDETFDDEFQDIKQKVKLSPIPEAILRVYRRIFR